MIKKERAANMYRLSTYILARNLLLDLILPVLFLVEVYFMAGLRLSVGPFFYSMLTVFLCIVAAQGLGIAIGASLMDLKRATTLASVTVMTFMLAGGYFVKVVSELLIIYQASGCLKGNLEKLGHNQRDRVRQGTRIITWGFYIKSLSTISYHKG
ncbi:hypothetical protein V6N13_059583 [Hibiscus sabdariffa]|uniref:ABC-2 type transporter transmembrane domain-containing protein n=1 Tax=Hibiscus sabdariffa TaxID=183260 RepID=A0ABR2GCM6_9ROSI